MIAHIVYFDRANACPSQYKPRSFIALVKLSFFAYKMRRIILQLYLKEISIMTDFTQARTNMVDCQIHTDGVILPEVLSVFGSVPREIFLPPELQPVAYNDEDIVLSDSRVMMEPSVHARMVQACEPKPTDIALDIGCGSGYSTAILSPLVSTVVSVEPDEELLEQAKTHWNTLDACNIIMHAHDLDHGAPDEAPFDIIIVNGAVAAIPQSLVRQLSPNGRMVVVLKPADKMMGEATLVQHVGNGEYVTQSLFDAAAPYLEGFEPKKAFSF